MNHSIKNYISPVIKSLLVLAIGLFSMQTAQAQTEAELAGEGLFKLKCGACHKPDKKLIGPPLNVALDEWDGDKEAMYTWVRNWQEAIDAGYDRAKDVVDYDPSAMNLFPDISDEDLDNIFAYVANPPIITTERGDGPNGITPGVNWMLLGILAFLGVLSLILARIGRNVERIVAEKDGEPLPEPLTLSDRVLNKKMWAVLALAAFFLLGYKTFQNASGIGRSLGYQPEQPIKFSHKLHAGTLEIDCQYCHSSATSSKSATIPAVNVCMNCHSGVSEGTKTGTKEIQKIYDAAGFNPETREYTEKSTGPLEWTKIHNLPDHVFFSHAQHVGAGKVECQTCHGPIEEMEVVKQFSNLSMGWCINCHRDTKVQFADNVYYSETFKKFTEQHKSGDLEFVTVEKIGGTECQKCHY